jgi:predicted N-acetyltransferase YhbS
VNRDDLLASHFGALPRGDLYVEVAEGDDVRAHVGLYWRTVGVGGQDVEVLGLGLVCTDPAYRLQGFASALIDAAHQLGVSRGIRYAMLWGDPAFYGRFGYAPVGDDPLLLACQLSEYAWPAGPIDTRGQHW